MRIIPIEDSRPSNEEISSGPDESIQIRKLKVNIERSFSAEESKIIQRISELCLKKNNTINWEKVLKFFDYTCDKEIALKKIRNNYYNTRSKPARKATKVNEFRLKKLGLDI
jgi:hypothetical protein